MVEGEQGAVALGSDKEGRLARQGTWVTVVLWLVTVPLHLGLDTVNGVGQASLMLYVGLTLGVQQILVVRRAVSIQPLASSPAVLGGRDGGSRVI